MKKVFALVGALLVLAACKTELSQQSDTFEAQIPEKFAVSFTVNRADAFAEGPGTRATIKSDWGDGDMIMVFFKGVASPKFMQLFYDGYGQKWEANYMGGLTAADLANAPDKKMTAIYMPYGKFVYVMAQDGKFVFPVSAYNGIFYMAQQVPYACKESTLVGTLDLVPPALEGSDKYVHFDIGGHYPGHRYSLYQAHVKPLRLSSVSADGTVNYVKGEKGKALAGLNDTSNDMTSFSGILDGSVVGKAVDYQFSVNDETESVLYTRDAGVKTLSASKYIGIGNIGDENVWNANEYVYLGLNNAAGEKICWAKADLGASPGSEGTEDGQYYTWMRTTGHYYPDWYNYKYSGSNYESDPNVGDPATAALGGLWRLPTKDEFEALRDIRNTSSWLTAGGLQFFSRISGYDDKSIILRTAGFTGEDGQDKRTGYGLQGYYWTSSESPDAWGAGNPVCFFMRYTPSGAGAYGCEANEPWKGFSVRPVFSVASLEEGAASGGGDEAEPAIRLEKSSLTVSGKVTATYSIPYTIVNRREGPEMLYQVSDNRMIDRNFIEITPTEIRFEVSSNIGNSARTGKITLSYLGSSKEITITQTPLNEPLTVIHVDKLERKVSNEAGSYKIEYSVDNPVEGYDTYVTSTEREWCTARLENGYATFTVLENTSLSERRCTVSVLNQAANPARVLVIQSGKPAGPPDITIDLDPEANNNVNAEGENAYNFYAHVVNPIGGVELEMSSDVAWMTHFRHTDNPDVHCFTVSRNTTGRTRYGHLTLQYASVKKQIKFEQQAEVNAIVLNPGDLKFNSQGRTVSFNVNLPEGYSYDDLTVTPAGDYGSFIRNLRRTEGKVFFEMGDNNTYYERTGEIIVRHGDSQASFHVTQTFEPSTFVVSPATMTLNYQAQKQIIDVQITNPRTYTELSVIKEGEASWLWSSAPNGVPTINVAQNATGAPRTATVQIRYTDPKLGFARLTVTQNTSNTSFDVSPEVVDIEAAATTKEFTFTITDPLQGVDVSAVTTSEDWIQILSVSDSKAQVKIKKNYWSQPRKGSVTFSYGNFSRVVSIRQAANSVADGFVDLGLPSGTFWAEKNLGAATVYDPGNYYAWGETATKSRYFWNNYAWGTEDAVTKYNASDNVAFLVAADDPATKANAAWASPTKAQFDELMTYCDCEWVTLPVEGLKVSSKVTDTYIFFPVTGEKGDEMYDEWGGFYWTNEVVNDGPHSHAYYFLFMDSGYDTDQELRFYGMPVRPVKNP